MSRPFPRLCATCRERAVRPVALPSYSTNVDHDGRSYTVELTDVSGTQCGNCGALILEDSVSDRVDNQLRDLAGLLHPEEIRSQRQALNLTQKIMAQTLQIGEATLSRWETGAQIQQRFADRVLRAFFALPALRAYYGIPSPVTQTAIGHIQQKPATSFAKALQKPIKWSCTVTGATTSPASHKQELGMVA